MTLRACFSPSSTAFAHKHSKKWCPLKNSYLIAIFLILAFYSQVLAGNLSLIEKRLTELDKLNREAVQELGDIPKDGSIHYKANVYPQGTKEETIPGVSQKKFSFDYSKITSIEKKHPYTVQIGTSTSQLQCYKIASMLRRSGYPAFTSPLQLVNKEVWHRIFIGSFAAKDKAFHLKTELESKDISEGIIRNLPYAIQIGDSGSYDDLKSLRTKVTKFALQAYSTPVHDQKTGKFEGRLLVGAYKTKKDADYLLKSLRAEGFDARIVLR